MPAIRLGFILASNRLRPLPSTRISVLNMFQHLDEAGFTPSVIHEPLDATETPDLDRLSARELARDHDLVFFQKCHGPSALRLARQLEDEGVRTVFGVCDVVEPSMVEATTATVVVTAHLRTLYPSTLQERMHVVHDGIEAPTRYRRSPSMRRGSRADPLRAVLVTSSAPVSIEPLGRLPDWLCVTVVGAYPRSFLSPAVWRWVFQQLAEQPAARRRQFVGELAQERLRFVRWDPEGVYEQLERADVAVIPVDPRSNSAWAVKSENRLTLKMAAGLPVVCSPIPAYEQIVQNGENALFAHSRDDWMSALESLRDPARRAAMGVCARASVLTRYSKESQATALVNVLREALSANERAQSR